VELDELHDQLATVRDQIETVGGISTVAAVQEALTNAENELDSILHQFQNGSPNMLSVSKSALHHFIVCVASAFTFCVYSNICLVELFSFLFISRIQYMSMR